MKMNKKGFTLIELLAVIVILAIVALVATPIVMTTVDNAKKSAAKASANNVITAINSNEALASFGASDGVDDLNITNTLFITTEIKNSSDEVVGYYTSGDSTASIIKNLDVSGDKPKFIAVDKISGKNTVNDGCMVINGYVITIKDGKATSAIKDAGNGTCSFKSQLGTQPDIGTANAAS